MTTVVQLKQSETGLPDRLWVGVTDGARLDSVMYLPLTGGRRSGEAKISPDYTTIVLDSVTAVRETTIYGGLNGITQWGLTLGDDFVISRHVDKTFIGAALTISRSTGRVTLEGDPIAPRHAATKHYVDTQLALNDSLKVNGGTMLGYLVLAKEVPVLRAHAANKGYVDDSYGKLTQQINTKLSRDGGTMRGMLTLWGEPIIEMHAVPKHYVDALVQHLLKRIAVLEEKLGV